MQLSELLLDRYLYKDSGQNPQTRDSVSTSMDSMDQEPTPIPSGGAAQDINTSNVFIDGAQLEPGTFPVTVLDVANWGWTQTSVFTSASATQVNWGAGTFTSSDGTSYSISGGNTGTMSSKTYIYLDLLTSETAYQKTTTPGDAVGIGKVLVAVAQNGASSATFNLNEANQIVGDNILANTINATKMNVAQLSAITADIGSITSGTITGALVRTSSSGKRVEISSDEIRSYDSSNVQRMRLDGENLYFYDTSGNLSGGLLGTAGGSFSLSSGATNSNAIIAGRGTGVASLAIGGSNYFYADGLKKRNTTFKDLVPSADNTYDLGANGRAFYDIWTYRVTLGGVTRTTWPAAGTTTLSGLTIDTNKNWGGYRISNLDALSFNGSGSYIENVSAVYLLSRSTTPGSPTGALWYHSSGGTEQIRTYLAGYLFSFDLSFA